MKGAIEHFYIQKKEYITEEVDCGPVIEKAFSDVHSEIPIEKEVVFLIGDIPNIQADREIFYYIIKYLIQNSIHNNSKEHILIDISSYSSSELDAQVFSVRNNNSLPGGKDKKKLNSFFKALDGNIDFKDISDPLFEKKASNLILASALVKQHNGGIWLDLARKKTTFSFFLGNLDYSSFRQSHLPARKESPTDKIPNRWFL